MAEDIDKVIDYLVSLGWTVDVDSNGYRRMHNPAGVYVVRYPATPGRPQRRLLEVITAIKKEGVPWPQPSKSEQRAARSKAKRADDAKEES